MKTADLVSLLAAGVAPVRPHGVTRRIGCALGVGCAGAMVVMLIGFGMLPDLANAARQPMFWVKLAFAGALILAAFFASDRLSRPGGRVGAWYIGLVAPVLALWMYGAWVLSQAAPDARRTLVLGDSWRSCAFSITLLAVPILVSLFWAMKGLAPTRPALTGAGVGLLAGAAATLVYTLHCPEMAAPFVGIWYVAGIGIPTATGAVLGARLLRW